MPKVVVREVETIGDDEWVDITVERAIDGVLVCCPPIKSDKGVPRLIRARVVSEREISEEEVAAIYAKTKRAAALAAHATEEK